MMGGDSKRLDTSTKLTGPALRGGREGRPPQAPVSKGLHPRYTVVGKRKLYIQYTLRISLDSQFSFPCSRAEPVNRDRGVAVTFWLPHLPQLRAGRVSRDC